MSTASFTKLRKPFDDSFLRNGYRISEENPLLVLYCGSKGWDFSLSQEPHSQSGFFFDAIEAQTRKIYAVWLLMRVIDAEEPTDLENQIYFAIHSIPLLHQEDNAWRHNYNLANEDYI